MKKLILFFGLSAAIALSSCTAFGQHAMLETEIDSLSYHIGVARVNGLAEYLQSQGVDSTLMAEFLNGFKESSRDYNNRKLYAHAVGVQVGRMVSKNWIDDINNSFHNADSTFSINRDALLAGFIYGVANKLQLAEITKAEAYVSKKSSDIRNRGLEAQYGENRAAGEKFLAENKTKEGVVTTASGLQYKVITEGKGAVPTINNTVKVNYRGTLIDGTEFDSSYARNEPASFRAGQVIEGWREALTLMPVGSKWMLYIPSELGYGTKGAGEQIKPFSTLIFEVELLAIEK